MYLLEFFVDFYVLTGKELQGDHCGCLRRALLLFKEIVIVVSRYPDYREPPSSINKYDYTPQHWHVVAAQFIFVVVFEVCLK